MRSANVRPAQRPWGASRSISTLVTLHFPLSFPPQSRLRRQDVGPKTHLGQLDRQISELQLGVRRPCGEAADSDSRPSSGSPRAPSASPRACLCPQPGLRRRGPSPEGPLRGLLQSQHRCPSPETPGRRERARVRKERGCDGEGLLLTGEPRELAPLWAETTPGLLGSGSRGGREELLYPGSGLHGLSEKMTRTRAPGLPPVCCPATLTVKLGGDSSGALVTVPVQGTWSRLARRWLAWQTQETVYGVECRVFLL